MNGRKIFLILQCAVCVLLTVLLAASAVCIYRDGLERRAADPKASIYTAETVADSLASFMPLFCVSLGLLAAGLILGLRDERAEMPVRNPAGSQSAKLPKAAQRKGKGILQAAAIIAAIAFIIAGVFNGSARDVLIKAITICTECVGLG